MAHHCRYPLDNQFTAELQMRMPPSKCPKALNEKEMHTKSVYRVKGNWFSCMREPNNNTTHCMSVCELSLFQFLNLNPKTVGVCKGGISGVCVCVVGGGGGVGREGGVRIRAQPVLKTIYDRQPNHCL